MDTLRRPIYFDNAASTAMDERVRQAMRPWLEEEFGNPGSAHSLGVRAAEAIDAARAEIARVAGTIPSRVVFTSGGTEANNLGVIGIAHARANERQARRRIVLGPAEHPSVREAGRSLARGGFEVLEARLAPGGELDLDHFATLIDSSTLLVAQMLVQNEWGSLYPVRALSELVRSRASGAHLHVDAVQGLGKVDVCLSELGADSIALSAHKVHGPKGVGALCLARQSILPRPLLLGGGQEHGLRSGTQNVAGIVAFGRAAILAEDELGVNAARFASLRSALAAGIRAPARILSPEGSLTRPIDSIALVHAPGIPAEVRVHHLQARGVYASAGAACQARKKEISPSLLALGLDPQTAREVIRLSFSAANTVEEVERFLPLWREVDAELEALRP
jgi:cysteine desulfurase